MTERQKTIVLTGASRGIGHATAIRFYNEGWRIITCARRAFPKGHPGTAPSENHIQIDLADMIYFLCSDQSKYVSGAEIHVNGGQHV